MAKEILVIAADLDPEDLGGAEVHLVEVIKRLKKKIKFTVMVGNSGKIKKNWQGKVRVVMVRYPKIRNLYNIIYIVISFIKAIPLCSTHKYNWIWAKQEFPQGVSAVLLGKVFGINTYITAQNPRAYKEEMVVQGLIRPLVLFGEKVSEMLVKLVMKNCTLVGAVSNYSKNIASDFGAKKVVLIPNGVDLQVFNNPKRKKRNFTKIIRVVSHSTLIPRNGLDTAIEGLVGLPVKLPWQFIIAGEGPERSRLQEIISRHKVGDKVKLVGSLNKVEVVKLLSSADVYLRPSRYEGFGVSFLEAMAMDIPVITTHAGGQKDFIFPNETGLVVAPNDPGAISRAVTTLIKNPLLYRKIIKQAKLLITSKYSWNKVSENIYAIFS